MDRIRPLDEAELASAVADAGASGRPFEVLGGGSKRALGRPVEGMGLDLSRMAGIVEYEPAELVITARAGTRLADVEAALAANNQVLAFEPPDLRALLGPRAGDAPTLGGMVACNHAGPRRVRAGSARDSLLGVRAVNGRGEAYKAGGRVVKNVTGYDICKLHAGAMGTLSVLTEISLRTVPRPERESSVAVAGLDDAAAVRLMTASLNSPNEVAAAAHLPAGVGGGPLTLLRLEGPRPSVLARAEALLALAGGEATRLALAGGEATRLALAGGEATRLDDGESARAWREIAEVRAFAAAVSPGTVLWRVCVPAAEAARVAVTIGGSVPGSRWLFDWGGGLLWLQMPEAADAHASRVRGAVGAGGHATLIRAPASVRCAVPVYQPLSPALAALGERLRHAFDPHAILNPGRLHPPA